MLFELCLNRGDHARRTVADIQAADAAGKIEIAVAVYVFDGDTVGACSKNRRGIGGTARNGSLAARHQRSRLRPGNFCFNLNCRHFSTTQSASRRD